MYRRLGRTADLGPLYEKALALTQQEPERQLLQERKRQLKWKDNRVHAVKNENILSCAKYSGERKTLAHRAVSG
jgi:hypothetical protein